MEICQKCGDKGYSDCLIYCSQCKVTVEHLYCLDNLPDGDRGVSVIWSCEQCAPKASSALNSLSSHPVRRSKRLRFRKRKKSRKRNNTINFSKVETDVQNCDTATALQSHNLCLKGDTQMNEDMPDPAEVTTDHLQCKGNYRQHLSEDNREGAKMSKKQRRKLILDDEEISEVDSGSAEDGNSLIASDVRDAPFGLSSHKSSHFALPAEITTYPLPYNGSYHQHFSDDNHEGANKSKKQRRKLILEDEEISEEDTGSAEDGNSPVALDVRNAPFGISNHMPGPESGYYGPAQPVIDSVWRGCFNICNEKSRKEVGVVAHLSNKACLKVLEGANALPTFIGVKMLPRPDAWPPSFSRSPPTDENIGLYFFPESKSDKALFDGILYEIIDRDLALKCVTDNADLLIFSSLQLPPLYQRFRGDYYLWGVFRRKQVSHPPQPAEHLLIRDSGIECAITAMPSMSADDFGSQKGRGSIKTWSQWSPLSSCGSDLPHSPLHQKAISSGFSLFDCTDIVEKSVDNEHDLEKQLAYAYEKEEEQHAYEEKEKLHEYEKGEAKIKDCDVVLLHSGGPWLDSSEVSKEIGGPCLELFPLEMEDIAVVSKAGSSIEVDLELALGRSGREDSKSRSPGCMQLIDKSCTLGLNNGTFQEFLL
ncbi:uncharacterized protein LOC122074037 isoform X2 [Macadamia integrifolia]|uniref:uncharacterized protein LOC122074037 isoform X2 n=1 Tax=Macadamia integrifolia TaxID=60698 RepID=UPI001C4E6089|nr:uncharacterized protein LOC122074037 isoform X2 [Macadamia integrifolia]